MKKNETISVIPTDTIYGVVASALSKKTVERAYKILKRNPKKPFIILLSSIKDLELFNIALDEDTRKIINKFWPGKVSIVLPCLSSKFKYLHRGTKSLAFRVPKKNSLIDLLKKTGPLISTSANPEGKKPAETIAEAKVYFGKAIDAYASGGKMKSLPSTLIEIKNSRISVIREGAGKISKNLLN
jgi:L-threonylcarbamoyladenylate synthase